MSSDIVLTAALRNNLLSLQNTQRLIDTTQLRLATGLKVNSALDNPKNYFTAQSLNNRASDLTRLLDGIGQSIRTIESANQGVTALTKLVEQAQSVVDSARDALASAGGQAVMTGSVDLSGVADLTAGTYGTAGIAAGDTFDIITTDDDGVQITETITVAGGDTAASLTAKITDAFADNREGEIKASVTSEGFLRIESKDGRSFRVRDGAAGLTDAGFTALGFDRYFQDEIQGAVTRAAATVVAGSTIRSLSIYEASGDLAEAGDLIIGPATGYIDEEGNTLLSQITANDTIGISIVADGTSVAPTAFTVTANSTFQDLVDHINQNTTLNPYIEANFDAKTGSIEITSLTDSVYSLKLETTTAAIETFDLGFGDSTGNLNPYTTTAAGNFEAIYSFSTSTTELDQYATDYNSIREQINSLVEDANYRGVNLLKGDDLVTYFNEDNTNTLTTEGSRFTAEGLGLTKASFRGSTSIELSASQLETALGSVRSFGSTLSNNLAIIQTRQDFTKQTINTLTSGAGDLTVADQNEEGANLLALQTRQALGTTSLSLASQSQQSVLRLF